MKSIAFARSKLRLRYLVASLAIAAACFMLLLMTKNMTMYPYHEEQLRASKRMEQAESLLKKFMIEKGIPIETDLDPNMTGLIGPEWTPLTTTLGNLEAKRSTLNPNFAALMVRYFHEAGLKAGDVIAVGASGSFPGLAIATLCAAREMGIKALAIASFGSSMYGATRPEFTIPKMIRILSDASIIPNSLIAVSPGADQDYGESPLFENSRDIIKNLAKEAGVEFIDLGRSNLEASIAHRLQLFDARAGGERIMCFVNIGGASPNSGTSPYTLEFPQGLVVSPPRIPGSADKGLVYEFASRGIPVINLLNIRLLANKNGLPYDPIPLPRAGEGGVYQVVRYQQSIVFIALIASIAVLAIGLAENYPQEKQHHFQKFRAAKPR